MLRRLFPDRFIWILIGTIALASVLPASGVMVPWASLASGAAVFLIFLLHGIKLSRAQVLDALTAWKIHALIALFVFAAMPAAGLIAEKAALLAGLPLLLASGFLFCGILPTTVQSATTYTSLAGGNVAISVVASAALNLAAILLSPLLFALLAGSSGGVGLSTDLLLRIVTILLLPFVIGQMVQRWCRPWVLAHPALVRAMDQSAIAIAVYVAFSAAVVAGVWSAVSAADLGIVTVLVIAMLAFGFAGAWALGRAGGVGAGERIAMLFAGSHKSIAVGAPLAALLFPVADAGMVLIPVLLYHLLQLTVSAWIAAALTGHKSAP